MKTVQIHHLEFKYVIYSQMNAETSERVTKINDKQNRQPLEGYTDSFTRRKPCG